MEVLILGDGADGTVLGWLFSQSGHNVTHVVRHNAIVTNTLTEIQIVDRRKLLSRRRKEVYQLRSVARIPDTMEWDLVLVPLQLQFIEDGLRSLSSLPKKTTILVTTPIWGALTAYSDLVSPRPCLFASPDVSVSRSDNSIHAVLKPRIVLGTTNGAPMHEVDSLSSTFHSMGVTPEIHDHIDQTFRIFLAASIGFWSGLALAGGIGPLFRDLPLLELCRGAADEAWELCTVLQIDTSKYNDYYELVKLDAGTRLFLRLSYQFGPYSRQLMVQKQESWQESISLLQHMLTTAREHSLNTPNLTLLQQRLMKERFQFH